MASDFFSSMSISARGMSAQRERMDVVAQNIANADATRTARGGPYRRRQVVFEAVKAGQSFDSVFRDTMQHDAPRAVRVHSVVEDPTPFREIYNPGHPDADARGIVKMPNVNPVQEMVDMTAAARSFEANVTAMEASKRMFMRSLDLLK
ncbi:MAG: flagellar basal body rod protein FlgC [Zetaproteobacteria bacterium]|nr:MAG: flagellar basal body rod protein FlgC [Zetaproteobacteria bacterium]